MYEILVAALREVDEYDSDYAKLMYDAADAIEELSKRSECPCWYGDIRFCAMLCKPIPEPPKEE